MVSEKQFVWISFRASQRHCSGALRASEGLSCAVLCRDGLCTARRTRGWPRGAPPKPVLLDRRGSEVVQAPSFAGARPFCLVSILAAELITILVSLLISHVRIKSLLMFSLTSQAAVRMPKISKLSWSEARIKEENNSDKRAMASEMQAVAHFPILRETY